MNTHMSARLILYLRFAAYLRPLPRTHQQQNQLLAQTHSRGRAMLAPITKISLPPCLGVLLPAFFIYAVARCKWNKAETNSNERTIVKFSL